MIVSLTVFLLCVKCQNINIGKISYYARAKIKRLFQKMVILGHVAKMLARLHLALVT